MYTCLYLLGVELNVHYPGKKVSRGLGSVMAVECVLLETGMKAGRSLRVLTSGDNVMVKVCLLKHSTQFNSGDPFNLSSCQLPSFLF